MDDDVLMDHDRLFKDHYHDALAIRAICDDLEFPAEYSPVFVNIHVRGEKHFRDAEQKKDFYKQVFNMLDPDSAAEIRKRIEGLESEQAKEILYKVCLGDALRKMDDYLDEEGGIPSFFAGQLENMKKMYFEEDYRSHMITLYKFFVKPFIASYDDQKIERAFHKGRLLDMIRRINNNRKSGREENSA